MRRLILLAAILSACSPRPDAREGYRSAGQITSIVFFDAQRFAGHWYEVAAFRPASAGACRGGQSDYRPRADGGLEVTEVSCTSGDPGTRRGTAVLTGPGRLTLSFGRATETYWMLWVDEGYRTAVVGMPSGRRGFILNRDASIPADRMQAAREILEWNGYDLARLVAEPGR